MTLYVFLCFSTSWHSGDGSILLNEMENKVQYFIEGVYLEFIHGNLILSMPVY